MGKTNSAYESFFIDELCNHYDELPKTEKCIRSLLTKENILRLQKDEVLSKKLLKAAKQRQMGPKDTSKEGKENSSKYKYL